MSKDVRVRITGDASGVKQAAREANQSLSGLAAGAERLAAPLQAAFAGVAAGATGVAVAGKLVAVQREFDVLNASLVTVTGSSDAAAREFAWIKEFAATTPFDLAQVTDAFIKMKAFGLDASEAALRSYGNTASAMGKDLNQMIEAVADAATGEFERLKEFGIKSSKEGGRVTFTFRGVSTTIRNSSEEITSYLKNIGDQDFAGAMAERTKTLDGAISNLGDSWNDLFRTINEAGVGDLILDATKLATVGVQGLINNIKALESYFPKGQAKVDVLVGEREGWRESLSRAKPGSFQAIKAQQAIDEINNEISKLQDEWILTSNLPTPAAEPPRGKGVSSDGGSGKKGRKKAEYDPLAESAKAYESALNSLIATQATATTSGLNLSSTQQQLMQVMMSSEWLAMPEAWRVTIAAQGEAAIAAEGLAAKMNEGRRVFESTRTPAEQLNVEYSKLNDLLEKGAIDWDTYARAVMDAQDRLMPMGKVKDEFEELKDAIEGWGKDSANAIVEFAMTGKSSVGDMVNSILADIARMTVQKNITAPLAKYAQEYDWGKVGSSLASLWPFENGGVMTSEGPLPLRAYANGGIANSPQLALYGEGSRPEAYVPLPDGRTIPVTMTGGGSGVQNVSVQVVNQGGQPMEGSARTSTAGDTLNIEVMLYERTKGRLIRETSQGGGLAPLLEGRYGLNPAAGARR